MPWHAVWRRPVRVVLWAAALAVCWFVLAPQSARADESSGPTKLLGTVTSAVTEQATEPLVKTATGTSTEAAATTTHVVDDGVANVTRTTDAVREAGRHVPVVAPVTRTATRTVDAVTTTAAATVDHTVTTTTAQVSATVEHTTRALTDTVTATARTVDETVGTVLDGVADAPAAPLTGAADTASPARPAASPQADPASAAVDGLLARRHAERTEDVVGLLAHAAPTPLVARVAVPVVVAVSPLPTGAPAPLRPLPCLVAALAAGALVTSSGGRGSHASGDALPARVRVVPRAVGERVRAATARAFPGPALIPGTSPD